MERGDNLGAYSPSEVSKIIDMAVLYGYDIIKRQQEKDGKIALIGFRNPASKPKFQSSHQEILEQVA